MMVCLGKWSRKFIAVGFLVGACSASAQQPVTFTAPLKVIVPFTPGALIDIIARMYAEQLGPMLGQSVVVENKPGAGGMVGAQRTLSEPVDRNTMLFVSSSYAVLPAVQRDVPYDTLKDFAGVSYLASSPTVVVVNAASPYKNLQDLISAAKKEGLVYGSAGINSATDLVGRYFNQETGAKLDHIPYKGVQEGVAEVAAGRVDVSFPPLALALPFLESGKIKALAVTSRQRSSLLPDTPTVIESGVPEFDYSIWYGVVMNAKTPEAVRNTLANAIAAVTRSPALQQKLAQQGLVAQNQTSTEFDQYIASEMRKFDRILKTSN